LAPLPSISMSTSFRTRSPRVTPITKLPQRHRQISCGYWRTILLYKRRKGSRRSIPGLFAPCTSSFPPSQRTSERGSQPLTRKLRVGLERLKNTLTRPFLPTCRLHSLLLLIAVRSPAFWGSLSRKCLCRVASKQTKLTKPGSTMGLQNPMLNTPVFWPAIYSR
jgi:hypothetical protein